MIEVYNDDYFMKKAFEEAQKAFAKGEIPVGAVVVMNKQIIGRGHNQTEQLNDFTAHAEMIAITSATQTLQNKYLQNATLYVTLEPCAMCASASAWSQISRIVYAVSDPQKGCLRYEPSLLHPRTKIEKGALEEESKTLINNFFSKQRT